VLVVSIYSSQVLPDNIALNKTLWLFPRNAILARRLDEQQSTEDERKDAVHILARHGAGPAVCQGQIFNNSVLPGCSRRQPDDYVWKKADVIPVPKVHPPTSV